MNIRSIYVASSWRNSHQQEVVRFLRGLGHEVYDFKNPSMGRIGFSWQEVDPNWLHWTPKEWRSGLWSAIAQEGYELDRQAMDNADICILVLPCGRSAHLEAGFMAGQRKDVFTFCPESVEPDLMNLLLGPPENICTTWEELKNALEKI